MSVSSPIETITPYVICVGTTLADSTAVAQAVERRAVVMVAPDAATVQRLLFGEVRDPQPSVAAGAPPRRAPQPRVIDRGRLRIDTAARQVSWEGMDIALSAREFELLAALASEPGRVWTFEELMSRIWRTRYLGDADPVVSAVKRLRRRLASVVELRVVSVRGVGFRLVVPD